MRFKLIPKTEPLELEIFPNRGGRIVVKDGFSESIVEGGIPKHVAINAIKLLISLGVLIVTPERITRINRNSIYLNKNIGN